MPTAEDLIIQHFGVKGMRWGVRKDQNKVTSKPKFGAKDVPESEDAAAANAAMKKARSQGTHTLSNKEMQNLINRMNMEQQYARMTEKDKSALAKGGDFVKQLAVETGKDVLKNNTKWVANHYSKEYIGKQLNIPTKKEKKKKD